MTPPELFSFKHFASMDSVTAISAIGVIISFPNDSLSKLFIWNIEYNIHITVKVNC